MVLATRRYCVVVHDTWRVRCARGSMETDRPLTMARYLMLPATFESGKKAKNMLRVSQAVVGIFAVALLTAGFSFTGLLCFAVRNPLFQAEAIFLPALTSSAIGLLTIFYDFLVFNTDRYTWNTPALLTTAAAAVSTIVYAGLLIWAHRRIALLKNPKKQQSLSMQMQAPAETSPYHRDSQTALWQEPGFYENYNRNMFPTAHAPSPEPPAGFDSDSITEEEMQRQQMLMLLLQRDESPGPDASQSTFHIDWQGRDEEEPPPTNGYYAPGQSATPQTPYLRPGIIRQMTNELPSWDGVWRTSARVSNSMWRRPGSRELRRQEIEQGR